MKKVKNTLCGIWRECFRYRLSGTALVVCLALSMIAAYYGITIYKNVYKEYLGKIRYGYRYSTSFTCRVDGEEDIPRLPDGTKCNLKLCGCSIYLDGSGLTSLAVASISSYEENVPLMKGRYAGRDDIVCGENLIVIGQLENEGIYEKDGQDYCKVYGEEYKIIGVAGDYDIVMFDHYRMLYWDCCGAELKNSVFKWGSGEIYFTLESNVADTQQIFEEYIKKQYNAVRIVGMDYNRSTAAPIYNENVYCIIIYVFCFLCIAVVMRFWLEQRKDELRICRAFGYTDRQIVGRLIRSFGAVMAVAVVFSAVGWLVVGLAVSSVSERYKLGFSWEIILPYFILFAVSIAAVSVWPVYSCLKRSIAENVRR